MPSELTIEGDVRAALLNISSIVRHMENRLSETENQLAAAHAKIDTLTTGIEAVETKLHHVLGDSGMPQSEDAYLAKFRQLAVKRESLMGPLQEFRTLEQEIVTLWANLSSAERFGLTDPASLKLPEAK